MINTYQTYRNIFEAARRDGNPDQGLTFKSFQRRSAVIRGALQLAAEKYLADLKELGETYSAKAFDERRKPLDNEYSELLKFAKQRCEDDLSTVIAAKRDQYAKCSGAPSAEQLRLLQALQMRSEVSAHEIQHYARELSDNIPALRVLREVAQKNGVPFPDVGNAEIFEEQLSAARDYSLKMLESLGETDDNELNYRQLSFWKYADTMTEADGIFGPLDGSFLTAPQKTVQAAGEDRVETIQPGQKPNAVKVYLRGDESLGGISVQFGLDSSEIRAANPGYDWSNIHHGDTVIVPTGKLRVSNAAGSIVEGQCVPTFYEKPAPAPKDGDEIELV